MCSDSTHSSVPPKTSRFAQPQMGVQALCNQSRSQWPPARSLSMHHVADDCSAQNKDVKSSSISQSSFSRNGQEATNVVVELRA